MEAVAVNPSEYHEKLRLRRENIFAKDSWLSKSSLWELRQVSLWRWRFDPPKRKPTAAMSWGTLVDMLLTTPEKTDSLIFNPYPDFRSKAARELRDNAAKDGKTVISADELAEAKKAVEAVKSHDVAGPIMEQSRTQLMLLGKLKGVQFRGLVDIAPENEPILYDFKTTSSFSPRGISSQINDFGYHVQAAAYLKLWNQAHPNNQRNRFRFIWQDSSPPYEVTVTELPAFDISAGDEWAAHQIDRLINATKSGVWPGITGCKVAMIGRPGYAAFQDEEELDGFVDAP